MPYIEKRIARDLAEAFLKRLKDGAPGGEEFKVYLESLEVIELTGTRDIPVFAVISKRMKVRLGDVAASGGGKKTVVYIYPNQTGEASEVVEMISSVNPWPLDLVPHGLSDGVILIHRLVTEGEMTWAREQVVELISKNSAEFRRNGIRWGKIEEGAKRADDMESLPDYMSLALRTEFGINADSQPHWRPAARWVLNNARKIIKGDDKIGGALRDWLFREHTLSDKGDYGKMDSREFEKDVGSFQKKVLSSG
jgi:hypothetical protein